MFIAISDGNPLVHIRAPYVNRALIATCCVVYVFELVGLPILSYAIVPAYLVEATFSPVLDPPPLLTLITHQFLHGGFLHLLFNMVALWVFGDNVEDALGHLRYLTFFLLCGIAGAWMEIVYTSYPLVPFVGASGAISGVMGAYLLLHPRAKILVLLLLRIPVLLPAALVVGADILLNLVMAFLSRAEENPEDLIAWWAHLGGFAAGMALVVVMRRPGVALFQPETVYPEVPFPWWQRFVVDFFPRRTTARTMDHERNEVAVKALVYFGIIYVLLSVF